MSAISCFRFVNGLVDTIQRGQYASSVSSLANQLGLPSWFVDLRHVATLERLPGLQILRNGCRQVSFFSSISFGPQEFTSSILISPCLQALAYLETHYWSPQLLYLNPHD